MNPLVRNALALMTLGSTSAFAIGPTIGGPSTGLWYNPSESGRGYEIDIQGDTMIVTTYVYTSSGDPIWYLSSGTYNHSTGRFQSSYDSYSDGQCFGCTPRPPAVHSGDAGPMTIVFQDDQHATLSYPGGTTPIVKFNYGFGSSNDVLYGEWALSYNISGLVGGDWIIFSAPFTGSDGTQYVAGQEDLDSSNIALGSYESSLGEYVILVKVGDFEDFYTLALDDRRGIGAAWVVPYGGSLVGNGSPAVAGRLLYKSELTTGSADISPAGAVERSSAKSRATQLQSSEASASAQHVGAPQMDVAHAAVLAKLRMAAHEKLRSLAERAR